MRILCRHGHFAFYPQKAKDIALFCDHYGISLVRERDFYTFPLLQGAPKYSLLGLAYLGLPAVKTFEGEPWEVMAANGFVYNLVVGTMIPKAAVTSLSDPRQVGYTFLSASILIQPGSRNASGNQILSYDGETTQNDTQLMLTEFEYE